MRTSFGLCLCLAACGAAPIAQPPPRQLPGDLRPDEFPGAAALLDGFDEPTDARPWDAGDRLLFGLRLRKHGEEHRWLMLLEVSLGQRPLRLRGKPADPDVGVEIEEVKVGLPQGSWSYTITSNDQRQDHVLTSELCPVTVKVFDPGGKQIGDSRVHLPADLLGRGMLDAVDGLRAAAADGTLGDATGLSTPDQARLLALMRIPVEAVIAAMSLLEILQKDDLLASYFWQVVEKPSLWSVVTNFGVSTKISMPFQESVPATSVPAPLPPQPRAFVIPLRVDVNGSPALFADLLATDPRRPLALCGGMVAIAAHHPTDSGIHFDAQLLAARLADTK